MDIKAKKYSLKLPTMNMVDFGEDKKHIQAKGSINESNMQCASPRLLMAFFHPFFDPIFFLMRLNLETDFTVPVKNIISSPLTIGSKLKF